MDRCRDLEPHAPGLRGRLALEVPGATLPTYSPATPLKDPAQANSTEKLGLCCGSAARCGLEAEKPKGPLPKTAAEMTSRKTESSPGAPLSYSRLGCDRSGVGGVRAGAGAVWAQPKGAWAERRASSGSVLGRVRPASEFFGPPLLSQLTCRRPRTAATPALARTPLLSTAHRAGYSLFTAQQQG